MGKHAVDIKIQARDEASKAFRSAGAASQHFTRTVGSALTSLKSVLGGLAVGMLIRKSLSAFTEQEQAVTEMDQALRTLGDTTEESRRRALEFAGAMQKVTIYGDEEIIRLQALAVNMGKLTGTQLERATKAALGLARAFKMDAHAAMNLVARAAQGQTQTLARYGIVLNASLSPQEKFNQLLLVGEKHFTEMAGGVKTFGEEMQMLKNASGDTLEKIGVVLTGLGKDETGYKWIRNLTDGFGDLNDKLDAYISLKEKNIELDKRLGEDKSVAKEKKSGIWNTMVNLMPLVNIAKLVEAKWSVNYEKEIYQKQNRAARQEIAQGWTDQAVKRNAMGDLKPMNFPKLPMKFLESLPGLIVNGLKTGAVFLKEQIDLASKMKFGPLPGQPMPEFGFRESRFLTLNPWSRINKTEDNTTRMVRQLEQTNKYLASVDRKAGGNAAQAARYELAEGRLS